MSNTFCDVWGEEENIRKVQSAKDRWASDLIFKLPGDG